MKKILVLSLLVASTLFAAEQKELEYSAQPKLGIIKGDYYKNEKRFRQGHLGVFEVVKDGDKIVHVEFNEITRPNYYNRYFQNVSKRYSSYNFKMFEGKGAAWIQGVLKAEKQMVDEQRLTGDFDLVAGASNSIEQSMVPLAKELEPKTHTPSTQKYYSIAEELGNGLTGRLKVIVEGGKIISCRYDEIFADSPKDIKPGKFKKYFKQSKYESVDYDEPSRIGFNIQMDELDKKVVATQDMFDLSGLPATEDSGDYKKGGYTTRNTAWDNYLKLAEKLHNEMVKDKVLNK